MARAKNETFIDKVLEEFGDKVLDNHNKEIQAISTGCLSLDTSIGVGGIPRGMITEISGPEGSGKTTVALNTAKQVANAGGKALYLDVENLLNTKTISSVLGKDVLIDNILLLTPDSAEDAFKMAEWGIDSGEFDLVIIDSIGAMASRKEKEKQFDEDTMMQIPRLVSKFCRRNSYSIRTGNVAVLLLNQIRDNVGSYVKSYSTPGGHSLKHHAAVRISLTKGEDLTRGKEKVGIVTKFVVKKNKLAPPFRSFTIPIIFGQGIDYLSDLLDFTKLLGIVTQRGAYYYFEDQNLGQGKAAARETLENDKSTLAKITEECYNMLHRETTIADLLNDIEDGMEGEE
jgi:recombination protein RecA